GALAALAVRPALHGRAGRLPGGAPPLPRRPLRPHAQAPAARPHADVAGPDRAARLGSLRPPGRGLRRRPPGGSAELPPQVDARGADQVPPVRRAGDARAAPRPPPPGAGPAPGRPARRRARRDPRPRLLDQLPLSRLLPGDRGLAAAAPSP